MVVAVRRGCPVAGGKEEETYVHPGGNEQMVSPKRLVPESGLWAQRAGRREPQVGAPQAPGSPLLIPSSDPGG